jgi:hypothetical protein
MFIPIVNLFAFGYLYGFLRTPRYASDGGVSLPRWNDWKNFFLDGVRLILFVAVYVALAFSFSLMAEWLIFFCSFSYLHPRWYSLISVLLVVTLPVFLILLMQYQRRQHLRDICQIRALAHYLRYLWWPMIWPALGFLGLQAACGVLYGLAWFVGFGVVFASFNELLRHYGDRIEMSPMETDGTENY